MILKKTLWLFPLLLWNGLGVVAQIDEMFVRDSIEIERGIAGSTDFEPFFRLVNETFDLNNRPLQSVIYRYLSASELVPHQRQTFQYNEEGLTTLFLLEEWDEGEASWQPVKQEESGYEEGRLISFLRKIAISGELQNRRRWTYQYNANGRETQKLLQGWDAAMSSWNNLSRKETSYTAEGKLSQQQLQRFSDGSWNNRRRRMWTWEPGQLQPSQTQSQIWSNTDQAWVNSSRKTFAMGANGLWSGSVVEEWDPVANDWVRDIKETLNIDLVNNTSSFMLERWEEGEWQANLRSLYNYSATESTALLQRWNTTDMAHENFLRQRSLFNSDRLPIEQTGMQAWNTDTDSWQNEDFTRRISYFWRTADPTSTKEPQYNHCVIPNPYFSNALISCELSAVDFPLKLEVYNLYGQLLLRDQVQSPSFQVNTERLPSGLYVFKLSDQRHIYQLQKVVVAH